MSSIVSMKWVKEHMDYPDVVLVDCRFVLGKPEEGSSDYQEGHLPGAVYYDLEKDLSAPIGKHGGRHPLPDPQVLAEKLGRSGMQSSTRIIAYDDQGGAYASRFWWLLRYYGHRHVVVMDQGYSAWVKAGYPITKSVPKRERATFIPRLQQDWVIHQDEMLGKIGQNGTLIIDSRDPGRYAGRNETIDPIAGHIPYAINHFWKNGMDEEGNWLEPEQQRKRFGDISEAGELIVYCGSGVTATPNILALKEAGYPEVKLYPGSWSDWISYEDAPVATGDE